MELVAASIAAKYFSILGILAVLAAFFTETVNLAIVAGVFSVVNTVLNSILLKNLKQNKDVTHEVRQIVDRRKQERNT